MMSSRAYYSAFISDFLCSSAESIVGELAKYHSQDLVYQQTEAWNSQIKILQEQLQYFNLGHICFELLIPRMGRRADVVLILNGIIFVVEFKVGEQHYKPHDLRQAQGYALDLSCFHEASHNCMIVPILMATRATGDLIEVNMENIGVTPTLRANSSNLFDVITDCIEKLPKQLPINPQAWLMSRYKPTPTIIEAAQALYANHDVTDIARSDAGAINLAETSGRLDEIIRQARFEKQKVICFVTGVPGAGKTLVGLHIATKHNNSEDEEHAVFLSGNGPLVDVLREALARDKVARVNGVTKIGARREAESFIQNIHHFRDEALHENEAPPVERVVIFDEAQRAWNQRKASDFMRRKKNCPDFDQSESEFLIRYMDRHQDWCVIIALIGGGQEINDGEAGLNGWFSALSESFSAWKIYYSEKLKQKEYAGNNTNIDLLRYSQASSEICLHLATSMRSFRAEMLSHFVHYLIHNQPADAKAIHQKISINFPIFVTRDLLSAKKWVRERVKGMETSGLTASSGAKRLKADGIFISNEIQAEDWFLNDRDDVRSCHFLEDTATEFVIQGLELDWCIVAWDADYRYHDGCFEHWRFSGNKWMKRRKDEQQRYLENSYRVLLTRARQGIVVYVPLGDIDDSTRDPAFYNATYEYLRECGIQDLIK